jgi:hypothetical protein
MSETPTPAPAPEEDIILEPGDPGYVDPNAPPAEPVAPGPPASEAPGADLRLQRNPGETEAEFASRTRATLVPSTSPTDIVPNRPNISMGLAGQEIPPEEPASEPTVPTPINAAAEAEETSA